MPRSTVSSGEMSGTTATPIPHSPTAKSVTVAIPAQNVADHSVFFGCLGSDWMRVPPTPRLDDCSMMVAADVSAAVSPTAAGVYRRAATSQNT
jgi:hypothetical protein